LRQKPVSLHVYEVARAKIIAASISFPMRCHSVGCGNYGPNAISNAIGYAEHFSRSHDSVIRVYDECAEKL
jgi:hypothetical protein